MDTIYLNETDTASALRVSRRTLQRWRVTGDGPPYTRLGERRIVYPTDALRRWADARTFMHRADELATAAAN